jgi:hypothetical protein
VSALASIVSPFPLRCYSLVCCQAVTVSALDFLSVLCFALQRFLLLSVSALMSLYQFSVLCSALATALDLSPGVLGVLLMIVCQFSLFHAGAGCSLDVPRLHYGRGLYHSVLFWRLLQRWISQQARGF